MSIQRIFADNDDNDGDKYRLLNLVHSMAGQMAVAKIGGWQLAETCTEPHFVLTVWTNGIVNIRATSGNGHHEYALYAVED